MADARTHTGTRTHAQERAEADAHARAHAHACPHAHAHARAHCCGSPQRNRLHCQSSLPINSCNQILTDYINTCELTGLDYFIVFRHMFTSADNLNLANILCSRGSETWLGNLALFALYNCFK